MKIVCIGRNYNDPKAERVEPNQCPPVFFMKPDTCLLRNNQPFFHPNFSNDIFYELEVVIKICRLGRNIGERFAHRYYDEVAIGVDFTAMDLLESCREQGLPWEVAKAFDGSSPISKFIKKEQLTDLSSAEFWLEKNGVEVQRGNTKDMILNTDQLIAHISRFTTLKIGDLIYCGTPTGVGPVAIGDRLKGYLDGRLLLDFFIR